MASSGQSLSRISVSGKPVSSSVSIRWPGTAPSTIMIPRSYEDGRYIQFETTFPAALQNKVDPEAFHRTIERINDILHQIDDYNILLCLEGRRPIFNNANVCSNQDIQEFLLVRLSSLFIYAIEEIILGFGPVCFDRCCFFNSFFAGQKRT
jgi:hypothetical protein